MRKTLKSEKGITLTMMVIAIILLLIIATVSINYSRDSIEHSKFMAMYSEIQIIQEKVNSLYSENKEIPGKPLSEEQKVTVGFKTDNKAEYDNYRYYSPSDLRTELDINSIEGEYLISVKDRDVICITPITNEGKSFINYRLGDISQGYNVEYSAPIIKEYLGVRAKVGDYVNYDPTTGGNATSANTKYTSKKGEAAVSGNGFGDQTFSAANYVNSGRKMESAFNRRWCSYINF